MPFSGPQFKNENSLTRFPAADIYKAQLDRDRNMDTILEIFFTHGQPPLLCSKD